MNLNTIKAITGFLEPFVRITKRLQHRKIGQRVVVMYHGVSRSPQFNCITQDLLREQISCLKKRYSVVPLSTLVENLISLSPPNQSDFAAITFDDGYVNFAELALPVLQEYSCHATVFVPTGKVGSYNDWDEGMSGFHKMAIMSYRILRQLPEDFVEIGSHGISHVPLDHLPPNESEREIVESRLEIEQNIARPVQFFAFPFGAYPLGKKFTSYDKKGHFLGGYGAACTSWWGRFNSKNDIYRLRRIGIWDSDSLTDFISKLDGYYDWLEGKERIGRFFKMMRCFL